MTLSSPIASRLQELFIDGTWIANTNYKAQLTSIDWKQAAQQIGNCNTIALLTFHINYYLDGLNQVFAGGKLEIKDALSFDMEPLNSEADWQALVDTFLANARRFIALVDGLTEEQLDASFVEPKYGSARRNIEGMLEHGYYHLGQISLLKKQIQTD